MIHQISLAECLEASAPPTRVLNVSACDDAVFVRICAVDQDHQREVHREVAEISVSLPALMEALALLATDEERENLRPVEADGQSRETKLAGRRIAAVGVSPSSLVLAVTDHLRHTPAPAAAGKAPEAEATT